MRGDNLIETLKRKFRVTTDFALSKHLGISHPAIQLWKTRRVVTLRQVAMPPVSAVYKRSHARAKRGVWQIPTRDLFRYLLDQRKNTAQSYAEMKEARQAS